MISPGESIVMPVSVRSPRASGWFKKSDPSAGDKWCEIGQLGKPQLLEWSGCLDRLCPLR